MRIRRMLLSHLSDAAYDTIQSFHSDSAICFAIFLNFLPDLESQNSSHTQLKAIEVTALLSPDNLFKVDRSAEVLKLHNGDLITVSGYPQA